MILGTKIICRHQSRHQQQETEGKGRKNKKKGSTLHTNISCLSCTIKCLSFPLLSSILYQTWWSSLPRSEWIKSSYHHHILRDRSIWEEVSEKWVKIKRQQKRRKWEEQERMLHSSIPRMTELYFRSVPSVSRRLRYGWQDSSMT